MTVFVSLTTIDSRIKNLSLVIQSLLSNILPDNLSEEIQIKLYISSTPFLIDAGISVLPDSLIDLVKSDKSGFNFEIEFVPNLGPHRKYIFSQIEDDDILVTVDDDTIYPDNFLSRLLKAVEYYDCVVAFRGRQIHFNEYSLSMYSSWNKEIQSGSPSLLNLGTGKDGIAYKANYLHPSVWNKEHALRYAPKADDLWLKAHSLLQGVPTVVLSTSLQEEFDELGDPFSKASLFNSFNKYGGNDFALQNIDSYLMSYFQTSFYYLARS